MSLEVLIVLVLFYGISAAASMIQLRRLQVSLGRVIRWVSGLALLFQAALIVSLLVKVGSLSHIHPPQFQLLTSFALALFAWLFAFKRGFLIVSVILWSIVIVDLAAFYFFASADSASVLPSPWIWLHILLMLSGETLFFVAAAFSIVFLIAEYQLRKASFSGAFTRIPSLSSFDSILGEMVLGGFLMLTAGMGMGFFFAREFWEGSWILDPKVLFCILTWALYGSLLLLRALRSELRGHRSAWVAFLGLLAVVFLAWGVDAFFPSRHMSFQMKVQDEE